jgi:hypothetical protein
MSESRCKRLDVLGAISAGLIVALFCLILLWRDPLLFWNDDYELSILPVFADVARSWSEGHWPLLSPYSWVCGNLAGEYQYGTFSVFINAAVVLIWKLPLAFPQQAAALSITHLFFLAAGAFLLARGRKFDVPWSIFVALVAALNGWIICWGATDWFGALGAFAWFPWAWWGLERALDRERSRWRFLWPTPFVYLVVTGGFPYTVVMLAVLVAWLSIKSLVETKDVRSILPMLFGVALGFGIGAPAWLAIFDYVHGSGRQLQPASAHWQWIVPWRALPALVLPAWTVNWADFSTRMMPHTGTELACGLVAPVALIAAIVHRGRVFVRQIRWELLLLLLVLLLSMLPTAGMFRWSFRWLPFFHLILALCAAHALQLRGPRGLIALFLVGIIAIVMSIFRVTGDHAFPLTWVFLLLAGIWTVADFFNLDRRGYLPPLLTFAALLATYLCIPPNCGVPKYNLSQNLLQPAPLDPDRLYLSIYPPAEFNYRREMKPGPVGQVVRLGSTSMWARLHFINGYSPVLPAGIAREFKSAIHGEIDRDIGEYLLHDYSGALAELGVDGLIVARDIGEDPPESEWQFAFENDEGRVFHRTGAPFASVRSVEWIDSQPQREFSSAVISRIDESRNRVEADVAVSNGETAALLKFSRPYFPGYVARIGNTKLTVDSYRGLLPVVEVPAGAHGRLVLSYCPWWLIYGGAVSILSGIVFICGVIMALRS